AGARTGRESGVLDPGGHPRPLSQAADPARRSGPRMDELVPRRARSASRARLRVSRHSGAPELLLPPAGLPVVHGRRPGTADATRPRPREPDVVDRLSASGDDVPEVS